jgi:hypothetical protein
MLDFYNQDMRMDLRKARADQFTAEVFRAIEPFLRDDGEEPVSKHVLQTLFDLFYNGGFEAITDHMRVEAGLPLRDNRGWTVKEVQIMEARRLEAMSRPLPPIPIIGEP